MAGCVGVQRCILDRGVTLVAVVNISQLAAQYGLPATTLHQRIKYLGWDIETALNTPSTSRKYVEQRWGLPFFTLLNDFVAQDFTRRQTSEALGIPYDTFLAMVRRSDEPDPWGDSSVVTNWVRDTGEPFSDALARMARQGMTVTEVAHFVGYGSVNALRYAMRRHGINVEFPRRQRKPKPYQEVQVSGRWGPPCEKHPWRIWN